MKQAIGVAAAVLLVLFGSLIVIPYAIGAALLTMAEVDNQHCGVVFNSTTFTAAQVTDAYAPKPTPIEAQLIASALNAASADLGPSFDEFFDGTRTITINGEAATITNPTWAPLVTLRPAAEEDGDREGPLVPDPATPTTPTTPTTQQPMSQPVTMNRVLATIRQVESANNYRSDSAAGTASGAYQFTDATWNRFRGYLRAVHAPPGIQDERAAIAVAAVLQQHGLEAVPVAWYWPLALRDPSWMDRVPRPDYGNTLTIREYQQRWLVAYAEIAGGIVGGGFGPCQPGHNNGPNDSDNPNGDGDSGPVSGEETQRRVSGSCTQAFTVHQGFAPQTQALLNAACADGITFAGSGWRSSTSQIELRRKHCGTSHDAIYNMPSTQCRPPTARPGNSMHERGQAIDFTVNGAGLTRGSLGYRWLAIHAEHYGFHNLPSEPWHWSTNGR